MVADKMRDRAIDSVNSSFQEDSASDSPEERTLVTIPIEFVPAKWLVNKVIAGFGGTQKDLEILAATLVLTEEELLGKIPPPWRLSENPKEYFLRFAADSNIDLVTATNLWQQVKAFPEGFKELQKPRPIKEILDKVEQWRKDRKSPLSLENESDSFDDEVRTLIDYAHELPRIDNLLPTQLLKAFIGFSKRFNIQPFALIGILLPVSASLLSVGTKIEIDVSTDFYPPSILWTGLIAESGTAKSPMFDTILKPLEKLQAESDQRYQEEYDNYEQTLMIWEQTSKEEQGSKPKPPIPREFYFQDVTIEALAEAISKQPKRGVIQAVDELAGFINSLNQYKSTGKGSDRQKWLSAYDGRGIKVNRKGGEKPGNRLSVPNTAISLTGTIQPSTLGRLMGNLEEVDGLWARFCWIRIPLVSTPPPGNGARFSLGEMLYALYCNLSTFEPSNYRLDKEGHRLWSEWHIRTEQEKLNEPHPALRAIYPKARERAARIALTAHCIKAAFEGKAPSELVDSSTLEAAISFTQWTIGQARVVYAELGVVENKDSASILKFVERFSNGEWVSKRMVQRWYSRKPQIKANEAQEFMEQVVKLGYAVSNGQEGRDFQIKVCKKATNKASQTSDEQGISITDNLSGKTPSFSNTEVEVSEEFDTVSTFQEATRNCTESSDNADNSHQTPAKQGIDPSDNSTDRVLTLTDKAVEVSEEFDTVSTCQEGVSRIVSSSNSLPSKASTATVRNVSTDLVFDQRLGLGDRVIYRGGLYPEYSNLELVVDLIEKQKALCRMPDGELTIWLDLQLLKLKP